MPREKHGNTATSRTAGARKAPKWVRLPHQARSQEKLERFVAAAGKLINEKGFQATSVPDIAREAGCSVGLFYTRFKDKGELLRYLLEHYLGEVEATAREVLQPALWQDVALADMVRAFVAGMVDLHRRRPGLVLAFYENVQSDPLIGKRVIGVHREIERLSAELLTSRASEITHPDPSLAVRFGSRLLGGYLQQRALISRALASAETIGWDETAAELTRALLGYLGVRASAGDASPASARRVLASLPRRRTTT